MDCLRAALHLAMLRSLGAPPVRWPIPPVCFTSEIHKALRYKAAETEHSVSDLVNDVVRASLVEDAEDLPPSRNERKSRTSLSSGSFEI